MWLRVVYFRPWINRVYLYSLYATRTARFSTVSLQAYANSKSWRQLTKARRVNRLDLIVLSFVQFGLIHSLSNCARRTRFRRAPFRAVIIG